MIKIIFACLFSLLLNPVTAQQHLVDSITKELQQPMVDSNRAMSMMRLAIDYEPVDTARAYMAYRDAIKFAREKKLYYQLGRIYQNQSVLFTTSANYALSRISLDSAIVNYQRSNHPKAKKFIASAYGDIAVVLTSQNDPEQATEYYLKSISLFEKLGVTDELVKQYVNISTFFSNLNEFAKQKEFAYKAIANARPTDSKKNKFIAYFIIAHYYNGQGDGKTAKLYLDSAEMNFEESAHTNNVTEIFSYYLITAQAFRKMNQLDSSFYFFKRCLEVSDKYNYSYGKAEAQTQMGAIRLVQKKYTDAENYLLAGIEEARAVNYFGILQDGYKDLAEIYSLTGRYKQAYEFFKKYKELSDSIVNLDSRKNVTELEKKYETEKKQSQIKQLEAENKVQQLSIRQKSILNYFLFAGVLTLLIISLLFYRTYIQRQKLQQQRIGELETLQKLNATENVLKGEEQERTRLAKDLHDGLGGMLSGIKYSLNTMKGNLIMTPENNQAFERSIDMLDSSIQEMRRVAHNMMPEALVKFGLDTALKDFCNDINQSGAIQLSYQSIGMENAMIEQTTAITIYRIVQELVNNIMKHAAAKNAVVQVSKTNNEISVTVEDDGKGFDTSLLKQTKGIGWDNILNRIGFLKGNLDVESEKEKGTSVHIEIKI